MDEQNQDDSWEFDAKTCPLNTGEEELCEACQ